MSVTLQDFGLSGSRIGKFLGLSLLTAGCEGFGLALFLPVLQFVEQGAGAAFLGSDLGRAVSAVLEWAGLPLALPGLLGLVLVLQGVRIALIYARQLYTAWVSQDVYHRTRSTVFRELAHADYGLFDSTSTGQVVNIMGVETQRLCAYFTNLFTLASIGVTVLGYLAVMLWLSASMTLLGIGFAVTAGAITSFVVRHTRRLSVRTTLSNKDFFFVLVERLTAIRLVKLSAAADREAASLDRASSQVRDNMYHLARLAARVDLSVEPVVVFAGAAILYAGVGVLGLSLSQVGLFLLVLLRLLPQCKELLRARQNALANVGSLEAVKAIIAQARAAAEPQGKGGRVFAGVAREISLRGVSFTYPSGERPALDHVDLDIPAGRTTALVGPSGSGKSTLADLLPRLRVPQAGEIVFDGTPSGEFDLASLRRGIAFVSQDVSVLNDTVRANVAFGRPEAADHEVWDALRRARAEEFVAAQPQGLDAVLGERGARLSGGQRQRISLARALLQAAPVLVLDEPTSALDSESERGIQEALADIRAARQVTVIIIAHRMSTIREADRIAVIQDGKVAAVGSHAELLRRGDWYALASGLQAE